VNAKSNPYTIEEGPTPTRGRSQRRKSTDETPDETQKFHRTSRKPRRTGDPIGGGERIVSVIGQGSDSDLNLNQNKNAKENKKGRPHRPRAPRPAQASFRLPLRGPISANEKQKITCPREGGRRTGGKTRHSSSKGRRARRQFTPSQIPQPRKSQRKGYSSGEVLAFNYKKKVQKSCSTHKWPAQPRRQQETLKIPSSS